MATYSELKFIGADTAFNRNWTVIYSTSNIHGNKWKWTFQCGCGSDQDFTEKNFLDPQEAAITYREFHRCTADNANINFNSEIGE